MIRIIRLQLMTNHFNNKAPFLAAYEGVEAVKQCAELHLMFTVSKFQDEQFYLLMD